MTLLAAAGCNDDRKRVATDVFLCNPDSHTADYDCGDGFLCYSAAQSVGDSICVPRCDPDHADKTCPGGTCTVGQECLQRCTVGKKDACPGGGGGILSCVRRTYSPLESMDGNDGVCVPAAFTCATSDDCSSPVYDLCTSETSGQKDNPNLPKSGSICAQGNCARDGVACEPGSTCIKKILPAGVTDVPDVCTPNCLKRHLPDGSFVDECPVGFGCFTQAFPQTAARVCAPGIPGRLCRDPLGCVAGTCASWEDVGGTFTAFKTCTPRCDRDDDCLVYDRPGNANVLTHFSCFNHQCHTLQSLFYTDLCVRSSDECLLDPMARCRIDDPSPDGGSGPVYDGCNSLTIGLSLAGGAAALCVRDCSNDDECGTLTQNSHVTHSCVFGHCLPALPFFLPCASDASCLPTLSCLAPPAGGPPYNVCTIRCSSSAECASNPILGSAFSCASNLCVPKTESGCKPPVPLSNLCLAGQLGDDGLCHSPAGWVCDNDQHPEYPTRCASGQCVDGHCL